MGIRLSVQRTDPHLSVIIPVHNERENIPSLVLEIESVLQPLDTFELIVVDDGSTDDTIKTLYPIFHERAWLRVVCHRKNMGQSMAISTGIKAARGEIIITMDGDGQNDPKDIPRLLRHFDPNTHFLLVTGRRKNRKDTWLKRISSKIANQVRQWVLKDNTPDTGCGLKVFRREDFLSLPFFDHMHRFLPALFMAMGGSVMSVDVNHRLRRKGLSHYGTWDRLLAGIVDLVGVSWLVRRIKPIHSYELTRSQKSE